MDMGKPTFAGFEDVGMGFVDGLAKLEMRRTDRSIMPPALRGERGSQRSQGRGGGSSIESRTCCAAKGARAGEEASEWCPMELHFNEELRRAARSWPSGKQKERRGNYGHSARLAIPARVQSENSSRSYAFAEKKRGRLQEVQG